MKNERLQKSKEHSAFLKLVMGLLKETFENFTAFTKADFRTNRCIETKLGKYSISCTSHRLQFPKREIIVKEKTLLRVFPTLKVVIKHFPLGKN